LRGLDDSVDQHQGSIRILGPKYKDGIKTVTGDRLAPRFTELRPEAKLRTVVLALLASFEP